MRSRRRRGFPALRLGNATSTLPSSRAGGFTLIELMIVMTIIAVLAGIRVPNFMRARSEGQLTACRSNLKNLSTSLEAYSNDNAGRYPTVLSLVTPGYVQIIPTCPSASTDTYSAGFASTSNPDVYTVVCSGNNHSNIGLSPNYPQYTSNQGLVDH